MSGVLHAIQLGKSYPQWGSNLRRIASWFMPSIRPHAEHWVLQQVSFSVRAGEAVGLIGHNGAGKSTLLKLITGTAVPTQGRVVTQGRVAAILELGMGFSVELTGRQNATNAAGLMGYSPTQIAFAIPEIAAFAELGDYFDQPLRTYSTGMQMRLAFSVATAFKPDILIVDEALSVGDVYFQHKSFARMRAFKEAGVAIILVTHSLADVRGLCSRVIMLEQGCVIKDGLPDEVLDYFSARMAEKQHVPGSITQRRDAQGWVTTQSGSGEVQVEPLQLQDVTSGEPLTSLQVGQVAELVTRLRALSSMPELVVGFMVRDKHGHVVWGSNTWHTQQIQRTVQAGETVTVKLRFTCLLGPGFYAVSLAVTSSDTHLAHNYAWVDNALIIEVVNVHLPFFMGSTCLDANFSLERLAVVE